MEKQFKRIFSDKYENVILWENDVPGGKTLDVRATDRNIEALYNKIIAAEEDPQTAWDLLWKSDKLNNCYVWIDEE